MEINSSSMELYEIYPIRVQYELNKPNFNFYRFSSDVNGGTSIKNLQYNFKNSFEFHPEKILKFEFKDVITDGFNCDENCFVIYDGKDKVEDEKPLFWGYHKDFYFKDGTEYFSFRFSPKSNFWLFIQKTIDLLVFGLIVLLLYEGFKTLLKNNNSKTKFKIVRLKKNNKKKQT